MCVCVRLSVGCLCFVCARMYKQVVHPLTRVFKHFRDHTHTHTHTDWRSHLTSALGAVVDGPLVSVLVHDAVVDADAAVNADAVLNQLVLVRLGGKRRRGRYCLVVIWIPFNVGKHYFSC